MKRRVSVKCYNEKNTSCYRHGIDRQRYRNACEVKTMVWKGVEEMILRKHVLMTELRKVQILFSNQQILLEIEKVMLVFQKLFQIIKQLTCLAALKNSPKNG